MKRALVISLICVIGFAFSGLAATLSGSWDTDITILPQQTNFNDALTLVSVLEVTYTLGDWAFTSKSTLSQLGWTDQTFALGTGAMLGAFSLTSVLDFLPAGGAFESWETTAGVNMMGVSFDVTFELTPNDVDLDLVIGGSAGDIVFDAAVNFGALAGGCDLDWDGIVIGVDFPFGECATIASELTFSCVGFVDVEFVVADITVPYFPWLTLDAVLTFAPDSKALVITPGIDFGTFDCFDLTFALGTVPGTGGATALAGAPVTLFGDLTITAIELEVVLGDVTFTGISYLGGIQTYWEVYTISFLGEACCDGDFTFDAGFYFLDGGLYLFDLAVIDVDMTIAMTSQFVFNMGLKIDFEGGGFNEWLIGFLVTW